MERNRLRSTITIRLERKKNRDAYGWSRIEIDSNGVRLKRRATAILVSFLFVRLTWTTRLPLHHPMLFMPSFYEGRS